MAENTKFYCTAENTKYSTAETPEFCYPCRYDGVQPLRSILRKSLIHSFLAHPCLSPSSKQKHTVQPRWDSGIVLEAFFGIFRPEQTSVGFSQTRNMSCALAGWSWEPSTHSQGTTTGKAPRWLCPPSSTSHRSIPPPPHKTPFFRSIYTTPIGQEFRNRSFFNEIFKYSFENPTLFSKFRMQGAPTFLIIHYIYTN